MISYQPVILIFQIIIIYFLSRITINELFYFLRFFFKNDQIVFSLISVFFLPGTIIHEMGHYFFALLLMLNVREVKIFPEWEKNYIKLGRVLYEKKDFVRGIFVGLAPLILGVAFFWWLSVFKLFPSQNLLINIILGYIIFSVSSTMFSSKQDLVDLIYIIPLIIIVIGIVYIFDLRLDFILKNKDLIQTFSNGVKGINFYLFFSLIINLFLIVFFKSFRKIIRK